MAKTFKTAAELEAMINAELRTHDVCDGIRVRGITRLTDERLDYNWEPHMITVITGAGTEVVVECKKVLNDVLQKLQQKYDLSPED